MAIGKKIVLGVLKGIPAANSVIAALGVATELGEAVNAEQEIAALVAKQEQGRIVSKFTGELLGETKKVGKNIVAKSAGRFGKLGRIFGPIGTAIGVGAQLASSGLLVKDLLTAGSLSSGLSTSSGNSVVNYVNSFINNLFNVPEIVGEIGVPARGNTIINNAQTKIRGLLDGVETNISNTITTFISEQKENIEAFGEIGGINELIEIAQKTVAALKEIEPYADNLARFQKFGADPFVGDKKIKINYVKIYMDRIGAGSSKSKLSRDYKRSIELFHKLGLIEVEEVTSIKTTTKGGIFGTIATDETTGYIFTSVSSPEQIDFILTGLRGLFSSLRDTFNLLQQTLAGVENLVLGLGQETGNVISQSISSSRSISEVESRINAMIETQVASLSKSAVREKTNEEKEDKPLKGKKRKKRFPSKRKKKKNKKIPQRFITASIDVSIQSEWIRKLTFRYPNRKDINSDDKGTLIFSLKKGGEIRFVRVNRGTFSVIALAVGTGYRLWSQFWKRKLVSKDVTSRFIQRININDRKKGIREEIRTKRITYK